MTARVVSVLLYLSGIVGCWAQDPCLNPMEVPSLEKRDRAYVIATGERALNDRLLIEGWYDAGDKVLLESAPDFQHCGTRYPIWRQQKNGDTSTMCVRTHSKICHEGGFNIETKMCGTKEIFYLKKTIASSAYCFGKPGIPPTFNVKPNVTTLLRNDSATSKLEFRCEFSKHADDLFYTTNWVVNGDLVLSKEPLKWSGGDVIETHVLTEANLSSVNITQVGFELRCSVRASVRNDTAASVPVLSDSKFIGIKISNRTLELSEGESADISLQLTVPFGCGTDGLGCELPIYSVHLDTTDCKEASLKSSDCGTAILATEWDKAVTITVFGQVSQGLGSSSNILKLKLVTPDDLPGNKFWQNYTVGVITVQLIKNTVPIAQKYCYATNDPHMRTFDGRRYEHQYKGVFTMYKHKTFPIEVQIQTANCGYGSYNACCNCGVAIRAGRTVFELNRCEGQSSIWTLEYTLCEDNGDVLQVKKKERSYEVYLPTGGRVDVNVYSIYLNVYIYPSVQDENNSLGLCGTLTGNCSDDFVLRNGAYSTDDTATGDCDTAYSNWKNLLTTFSISWKVDNESDLFNPDAHASLPTWPQTYLYCSCSPDPNSQRSGSLTKAVNCTAAIHKVCDTLEGFKDVFPTSCTITERRRRRSADVRSESPRRLRRQAVNEWTNGWTVEMARTFCENLFHESRSVQACKNVTGVGISGGIDNCILDIQLTGTSDFYRFSVDTVRDKCLHEVLVDPELQVKNGTKNVSVYDNVVAEACLNDCSGKGTCTNGDCVCQTNYGGSDCSVDLTTPPGLSETETVVTCDMSRDACDVVSVRGETFVDGVSTCLVEQIRAKATGQESIVSTVHMATVVSISHAQCKVVASDNTGSEDMDYVRAYRISIANSAGNYGDSVGLIVFDSTCIRAEGGEAKFNWTVKGPYCLNKGTCVPHGARQPGNNCLVCDVSGNKRTWKTGSESRCKGENGQLLITVVASVGGVVLLLLLLVLASVCACKRNKREVAGKNLYEVWKDSLK